MLIIIFQCNNTRPVIFQLFIYYNAELHLLSSPLLQGLYICNGAINALRYILYKPVCVYSRANNPPATELPRVDDAIASLSLFETQALFYGLQVNLLRGKCSLGHPYHFSSSAHKWKRERNSAARQIFQSRDCGCVTHRLIFSLTRRK